MGRRAALGAAREPPPPPRDEAAPTLRTARVGTPARVVPAVRLRPTRARGLEEPLASHGLLALLFCFLCGDVGGDDPRRHRDALRRTDRGVCVGRKPDDDGIVGDATDGAATERTGEATAQLDFLPLRNSERVLQALERHVARSHASARASRGRRRRSRCTPAAPPSGFAPSLGSATRSDCSTPSCAPTTRSRRCTSEGCPVFSSHLCFAGLPARTPRSSYYRSPRSCRSSRRCAIASSSAVWRA